MRKEKNTLKLTVAAGVLASLSIIFGKLLAFNIGEVIRISFENLPIIMAGIAFGPLVAIGVGTVADLVGCLIVGYTINPLITLGAASIGAISGLVSILLRKKGLILRISVSTIASHAVGSILIKTLGISVFYGTDFFAILPYRIMTYAIIAVIESTIIYILMKNKGVCDAIRKIGGDKL